MKTTYFDRFTIDMTLEDALSASHPGPCDEDVKILLQKDYIKAQFEKLDPADIAAELDEYGAWDDVELADVEQNRVRILWIAAGDIREEEREEG